MYHRYHFYEFLSYTCFQIIGTVVNKYNSKTFFACGIINKYSSNVPFLTFNLVAQIN